MSSFASALDRLAALGAELAAPNAPRRKFDLAHMRTLVRALGDPQDRFPSVLIAGTNGKGSTAATLAHILAAAGLRTALYTSPHLNRVTERIRTNTPAPSTNPSFRPERSAVEKPASAPAQASGQPNTTLHEIPEPTFARLFFQVDEAAQRLVAAGELPHPPSYFETLTALAFLYFAEQHIDLTVLEVGLGGRLDATNIVHPTLSILTDIALDHQDYLGPTIRDIAREKAGILRPEGTLITLPQHPEANQSIGEAAVPLNVRAINAADYLPGRNQNLVIPEGDLLPASAQSTGAPLPPNTYTLQLEGEPLHIASPLPGEHQQRNLALAIAAAVELRTHHNLPIPNAAIEAGIRNTAWPGRLEFLPPNLLLDVAHNPAGAWTLRAALSRLPDTQPRTLLFSCLRDKDLREIAQILFPLFDSPTPNPNVPGKSLSFRPEARVPGQLAGWGGERDAAEKPASPPAQSESPENSLSFRPEARVPGQLAGWGGERAARSGETRITASAQPAGRPLPPRHHIVLTAIDSPRAATLDQLAATAAALDVPAHTAPTPAEALALARSLTPPGGLIVATGSIYLIGTLRDLAT